MFNWFRFRIAFQASVIFTLCSIVVWRSVLHAHLPLRNASTKESSTSLASECDRVISGMTDVTRCNGKEDQNPANHDVSFERLDPSPINKIRYDGLRSISRHIQYFFTIDLHDCPPMLPLLFGTIVQTMGYLGAENCALSIVEAHSQNTTRHILRELRSKIESLGAVFYHENSNLDPGDGRHERTAILAELRNRALDPMLRAPSLFKLATIVFVNDLIRCADDLLEVLYQQAKLRADITCAINWIHNGISYYDIWAAQGLGGDHLIESPQDSSTKSVQGLFWSDGRTQRRVTSHRPFQVYACWNGIATFNANIVLQENLRFQSADEDECYKGEPSLFCKGLWKRNHTRIQVVRSTDVSYNRQDCERARDSA